MNESDRAEAFSRYLAGDMTAEHVADLLGPGFGVADVVLETRRRFGRLPGRNDAFSASEFRQALALLGLDSKTKP